MHPALVITCWLLHRAKLEITNGHKHDHGDHVHDERTEIEQKAVDAEGDDAERSRLTKALVKVLPHLRDAPPRPSTAITQGWHSVKAHRSSGILAKCLLAMESTDLAFQDACYPAYGGTCTASA